MDFSTLGFLEIPFAATLPKTSKAVTKALSPSYCLAFLVSSTQSSDNNRVNISETFLSIIFFLYLTN